MRLRIKCIREFCFPSFYDLPSQKLTGIVSVWFKINNGWTKGNVVCLLLSWLLLSFRENGKAPREGPEKAEGNNVSFSSSLTRGCGRQPQWNQKSGFQEPQTDTRDFPGPDPSHSKNRETFLTSLLRSLELTRFL